MGKRSQHRQVWAKRKKNSSNKTEQKNQIKVLSSITLGKTFSFKIIPITIVFTLFVEINLFTYFSSISFF